MGSRAGDGLVVVDDFRDDEGEELLGERRVQPGLVGEVAQPRDLGLFTRRVSGRHTLTGLELTHLLGALEALGEKVDQGRVDVVYARTQAHQVIGSRAGRTGP